MAVQLIHQGPDDWVELQVGDSPTHVAFDVAEAKELISLERSLRELGSGEPEDGLSVWTRSALENLDFLRKQRGAPREAALDALWVDDLRRRGMDVE